jgi:acyl carrier protein
MEIKEFIEKFAEQFDDTPIEELNPNVKFKELEEWSSLIALSVIAMADEEYNVTLVATDIRGSETIEDLFNVVQSKLG